MKILCRIFLFCLLPIFLVNCKNDHNNTEVDNTPEQLSIEQKIARAGGFEHFKEIEQLNFTFNVKVNDSVRTQRSWEWNLRTDEVRLTVKDSSITYNSKTEAKNFPEIDQKFINDQYWLLFPFHLVWDKMDFEYQEQATAPISGETMHKGVVTYPSNAGYTPGDVYEIYFDDDFLIREWVYRSGGSEENAFAASWEDYHEYEGLKLSTMHKNEERKFQLYFTGIQVKKK